CRYLPSHLQATKKLVCLGSRKYIRFSHHQSLDQRPVSQPSNSLQTYLALRPMALDHKHLAKCGQDLGLVSPHIAIERTHDPGGELMAQGFIAAYLRRQDRMGDGKQGIVDRGAGQAKLDFMP